MFGKRRIIATQRALALFLKKYKNESYRQIARECGISKSSAARICIHDGSDKFIGVLKSSSERRQGRPTKVRERSERKLLRTLKEMQSKNIPMTVKSFVEKSGLTLKIASRRTFSRYPAERARLRLLTSQKKGGSQ